MKKVLSYGVASVVALQAGIASATSSSSNMTFGGWKVESELKWDANSADTAVQTLIANAIGFLYLVAVIYALWGGFNILTAGGDEEKVKKGKTVLIQALIGLVVIFLASSIINWIVTKILGTT